MTADRYLFDPHVYSALVAGGVDRLRRDGEFNYS